MKLRSSQGKVYNSTICTSLGTILNGISGIRKNIILTVPHRAQVDPFRPQSGEVVGGTLHGYRGALREGPGRWRDVRPNHLHMEILYLSGFILDLEDLEDLYWIHIGFRGDNPRTKWKSNEYDEENGILILIMDLVHDFPPFSILVS